jgi:hypothetical protein
MAITFEWTIKNLNADMRGVATVGYFEMQGTDENGNVEIGSVTVCFGADELKQKSKWPDADIDAYAETKRQTIEDNITQTLTARIEALENK